MNKIMFFGLLFLIIFANGCSILKPVDKEKNYFLDRISIEFNPNVTLEQARGIIKQYNCTIIKESTYNNFLIKIPQNKTIFEMRDIFQNLTEVKSASLLLPTRGSNE